MNSLKFCKLFEIKTSALLQACNKKSHKIKQKLFLQLSHQLFLQHLHNLSLLKLEKISTIRIYLESKSLQNHLKFLLLQQRSLALLQRKTESQKMDRIKNDHKWMIIILRQYMKVKTIHFSPLSLKVKASRMLQQSLTPKTHPPSPPSTILP